MGNRRQNEGKFKFWKELVGGGRCYQMSIPGKQGGRAVYYKEVDAEENTIRFWQEIYDDQGRQSEVHEKYPVDTGHNKI